MMTEDGAYEIIAQFGEEVQVYPQSSDVAENPDDPIYFEQTDSSESSYTEKVRVYSSPSEETLRDYGFDEDTESLIYNTNDSIEEGDEIEFNGQRFVVRRQVTNQLGNGPYLWVYNLIGK